MRKQKDDTAKEAFYPDSKELGESGAAVRV